VRHGVVAAVPVEAGAGSRGVSSRWRDDVAARFVFQKMSEQLNQQFPIDNRAGAAGMIGGEIVAKSPPDGYTVMVVFADVPRECAPLFQKCRMTR